MGSSDARIAKLFDPTPGKDGPPKQRVSQAERRLIDLQRASKRALLRKRDMRGVIEIAANAIFEIGRNRKVTGKAKSDPVERLRQWCDRRKLNVGPRVFASIVKKWSDAAYLMNVEDCGELLSLTPRQRVDHRLWSLGARHETAQQRHERKGQRQAEARERKRRADRERAAAKRRAKGAQTRAAYEARSVSEFCRRHGLARFSYQKAEARGRDSLLAFLAKKGISEAPPEKLATVSRDKSSIYTATHLPTFCISPRGRPKGRPANPSAVAFMLDRAASALAVGLPP